MDPDNSVDIDCYAPRSFRYPDQIRAHSHAYHSVSNPDQYADAFKHPDADRDSNTLAHDCARRGVDTGSLPAAVWGQWVGDALVSHV